MTIKYDKLSFSFSFFNTFKITEDNKEICIPDIAKMCDTPSFWKLFFISSSIKLLSPIIKASK